jgi:restriction system protein
MDSLQLLWEMALALVQILWLMWPATLVIIIGLLFRLGAYIYKTRRYAKAGMAVIDTLNGKEFEEYLEVLFKKLGYQVQRTPYQGDYGADLVLQQGDKKTVVQAKRYTRSVGVKAVQEAVAAKEYYRCDHAMVVTNSYFSRQAATLAKANRVELWNRDDLVSRLLSNKPTTRLEFAASTADLCSDTPELPSAAIPITAPTCAQCGTPVTPKVQAYCMGHPEIFHGSIYCYAHQKELRNLRVTAR